VYRRRKNGFRMVCAGKQTHVSRQARVRKLSVEPLGIETGRRSADLDQMSEDPLKLVGILNDGDYLHIRATLGTYHRIDFVDLCNLNSRITYTYKDSSEHRIC
jgi:hypothetical protein